MVERWTQTALDQQILAALNGKLEGSSAKRVEEALDMFSGVDREGALPATLIPCYGRHLPRESGGSKQANACSFGKFWTELCRFSG